MRIVADLHLHSKYSRAVSQQMTLPEMAKWAKRKGIDLLGTGDFTHPLWFREIKSQLEEAEEGTYKLKSTTQNSKAEEKEPLFLLTTEISSIYSQGGRLRRIHTIVFAPSLETVEKVSAELLRRGANLMSDGRPIIGLPARELAELVLTVNSQCLIIPAHAWTPWFSLYGSESGFDSINECFGPMSRNILAIETGLSSSPAMNWRISELDRRQIISFSDAHSPPKLGRELTVFEIPPDRELNYKSIRDAIGQPANLRIEKLPHIAYTVEFYPEEGKYHYTGHRNCQMKQSPEESQKQGITCSVCGKGLTVGVMHRVEQLAKLKAPTAVSPSGTMADKQNEKSQIDKFGVRWMSDLNEARPPYVMLVPLLEIISEARSSLPASQKVINEYNNLTDRLGSEFKVLLETPIGEIAKIAGDKVAEGIERVRQGEIMVEPGYDGVFGTVRIWPLIDARGKPQEEKKDQLSLF